MSSKNKTPYEVVAHEQRESAFTKRYPIKGYIIDQANWVEKVILDYKVFKKLKNDFEKLSLKVGKKT